MKRILIVAGVFLLLTGCQSNPQIVEMSQDTYMIYREDHGGIFGNASALKAEVIQAANTFAASQGKVVVPVSTNFTPMGRGPAQWASFEYQFVVVDKDDPAVGRTPMVPRADVVIENKGKVTTDIHVKDHTEKSKDVYLELMKLDDLRKKGIINEAEFEAQKKKILSEN